MLMKLTPSVNPIKPIGVFYSKLLRWKRQQASFLLLK